MENDSVLDKVRKGVNTLSGAVSGGIANTIREEIRTNLNLIDKRLSTLESTLLLKLVNAFIITLAIIFAAIAGYYLFNEILGLNKALSFIIIAVLLFVVWLIVKLIERGMH
jgi:hypothetical protein